MTSDTEAQLASTVLMIRPVRFHANPLAAKTNNFMAETDSSPEEQQAAAAREFDGVVAALTAAGVRVLEFADTLVPGTPDAVFPNNWMTTHADGTVVVYPMEAPNRRTERREDIIDALADQHGFRVRRVIDLSAHENDGHFLEGTGSLVLDRINHVAYACLSTRTHLEVLTDFAQQLGYEVVAFEAVDQEGVPIYHTNVMMNVGEDFAVICDRSIVRDDQREAVLERLRQSGREIISLSFDQMLAFAGNMLELQSESGERLIAMSEQAKRSLTDAQRESIERRATIVSAPIDDIEGYAGGSVRCMLAEIHLPMQDAQD
jgi:hypothetical protein